MDFSNATRAEDRIYYLADGTIAVRCQRVGHMTKSPFTRVATSLSEARTFRNQHDGKWHVGNSIDPADRGAKRDLKLAYDEYVKRKAPLRNVSTVKNWAGMYRRLSEFAPFRQLTFPNIRLKHAQDYVTFRLEQGKTQGARIYPELEFLYTLSKVDGVATLPFSVVENFKEDLSVRSSQFIEEVPYPMPEQVQAFLDGLQGRCYIFALLKWLTGMRNAELQELRVKDLHLSDDEAFVEHWLHLKGKNTLRREWRALGSKHLPLLREFFKGASPEAYAFPNSSRPVLTEDGSYTRYGGHIDAAAVFARYIEEAARKAGIMSPRSPERGYSGLKWMRHMRATLLATLEDDDEQAVFRDEQRRAAEEAAARSIGTGLETLHRHYMQQTRRRAVSASGRWGEDNQHRVSKAAWKREVAAKRRDAILMESTVVSRIENVKKERRYATRTPKVVRFLAENPTSTFRAREIMEGIGIDMTDRVEVKKYRDGIAAMARDGYIKRVDRGLYQDVGKRWKDTPQSQAEKEKARKKKQSPVPPPQASFGGLEELWLT